MSTSYESLKGYIYLGTGSQKPGCSRKYFTDAHISIKNLLVECSRNPVSRNGNAPAPIHL
jgi:hypothetical protein